MPKKAINLNDFSGGLNNNTNPRDLEVNESSVLNGLDIDIPGKIRLYGSVVSTESYAQAHTNKFNYGNGLVYVNLDRDPSSSASISPTELYFINDKDNFNIDIYDGTNNDTIAGAFSYGSVESPIDGFTIDGEIRITPTSFSNSNKPKWYGYVDKTFHLGKTDFSSGNKGDGVSDATDEIQKDYAGFFSDDMFIAPLKTTQADEYGYDPEAFTKISVLAMSASEITLNEGITFNDIDGTTANKLVKTPAQLHTMLNAAPNISEGYGGFRMFAWFDRDNSAADVNYSSASSFIPVYNAPSQTRYALFASNVYGNQESYPVYLGDVIQPTTGVFATQSFKRHLFFLLVGRMPKKYRQTGIKVYWALSEVKSGVSTNKEFGQKYLFLDIDFAQGIRYGGESNYQALTTFTSTRIYYLCGSSQSTYHLGRPVASLSQNEPYFNYKPSLIGRLGSGFKTSCIANRRAYIGNVAYYADDDKIIKGDTILKSRVNQFDTFTENSFIDVEVNDGDEIVALETMGNQLLEFKRNTLYIINISRDIEFLEGSYEYRGCEKPYHVVKGEGFIAWFNKVGVFLYNGKQVIDLTIDETGQPKLKNWRTDYYLEDSIISYSPDKKTIFILMDNQKVLQFDLKAQSWSYSSNAFVTNNVSNAITNTAGEMVFLYKEGTNNALYKWSDTPAALTLSNNTVLMRTPEFAFNAPDALKNINTIYINYKLPNTDNVKVRGIANGVTTTDILDPLPVQANFATRKISLGTSFKGIRSFALELAADGNAIDDEFELNDIQIVYRDLSRR
jgi:hypothetical protein